MGGDGGYRSDAIPGYFPCYSAGGCDKGHQILGFCEINRQEGDVEIDLGNTFQYPSISFDIIQCSFFKTYREIVVICA